MQSFLQQVKVSILEWPGNSPDINPIENLWLIMKKVAAKHPKNIEHLKTAIKEVCVKEIDLDICRRLWRVCRHVCEKLYETKATVPDTDVPIVYALHLQSVLAIHGASILCAK